MRNHQGPSVIAVFPERGRAESAIDELWHEGFQKDQVYMAVPGHPAEEATTATEPVEDNAASGAAVGAAAGAGIGAVAGAAALAAVPAIGPVLAGSMLAGAALAVGGGAAAGAAVGTYLGPFVAMGFSDEDARHYEEEYRSGRTIVIVHPEDRLDEALTILENHGPTELRTSPQE